MKEVSTFHEHTGFARAARALSRHDTGRGAGFLPQTRLAGEGAEGLERFRGGRDGCGKHMESADSGAGGGAADLGAWSFLPATIGFWLGILFLLLLDRLVPHVHLDGEQEGLRASLPRSMMVALAVALHNLPEGMAVGVVYAGSMQPEQVGSVSFASAFALAVGIALQNVPEGAIVAMPLRQAGMSRVKAFTLGMLSGAVEPLGALLTIGLAAVFAPMMPVMLSFAAGAMLYVVVEELVPEMAQGTHTNVGTVLFAVGFSLMMAMDYTL